MVGLTLDVIPWTGGQSATPKGAQSKMPFCLRSMDYALSLKVYELAVKGKDQKFRNDLIDYPLHAFCKKIVKYLVDF